MAVTNNKKQEELARNTQQVQSATPYSGMEGVSQNTANNLGNYQAGYNQSEQVTAAQNTLQQVQAQKPQGYTSKYQGALDNILQQIQNPKEFKYEFNGDSLFKNYADLYTQKGKQASLDAQAQAAGLTGGYGNSYGQQVGTQQYQQYLLSLYDKGMDLRDRAYQQYQDQLANNYNLYNTLQGADELDYGRYRDTVGDWQNEEQQAYNRALTAEQMDREQYMQDLDYWTGLAQVENQAYNTELERQEAIRQYDQNFAEQQRQYNESLAENKRQFDTQITETRLQNNKQMAYNYAMQILQNGKMPTKDLLKLIGLSEKDAVKMMVQQKKPTGSGGSGGTKYFRFTDNYYGYYDKDGKLHLTTQAPKGKKVDDSYYQTYSQKGLLGQIGAKIGVYANSEDVNGNKTKKNNLNNKRALTEEEKKKYADKLAKK